MVDTTSLQRHGDQGTGRRTRDMERMRRENQGLAAALRASRR